MQLKWHANRKLESVALVVADQPGADGDDSALEVALMLYPAVQLDLVMKVR